MHSCMPRRWNQRATALWAAVAAPGGLVLHAPPVRIGPGAGPATLSPKAWRSADVASHQQTLHWPPAVQMHEAGAVLRHCSQPTEPGVSAPAPPLVATSYPDTSSRHSTGFAGPRHLAQPPAAHAARGGRGILSSLSGLWAAFPPRLAAAYPGGRGWMQCSVTKPPLSARSN